MVYKKFLQIKVEEEDLNFLLTQIALLKKRKIRILANIWKLRKICLFL